MNNILNNQKSVIAFLVAALMGYWFFSSPDEPAAHSVHTHETSAPVVRTAPKGPRVAHEEAFAEEDAPEVQAEVRHVLTGDRADDEIDPDAYAQAETRYLESLADREIADQIKYADEEPMTEDQVLVFEHYRKLQRRKEMILELNGGEEPEITDLDRETVSQLLREEGLTSIYDEEP